MYDLETESIVPWTRQKDSKLQLKRAIHSFVDIYAYLQIYKWKTINREARTGPKNIISRKLLLKQAMHFSISANCCLRVYNLETDDIVGRTRQNNMILGCRQWSRQYISTLRHVVIYEYKVFLRGQNDAISGKSSLEQVINLYIKACAVSKSKSCDTMRTSQFEDRSAPRSTIRKRKAGRAFLWACLRKESKPRF